jgi:S-DNA-T family DNA segregation ATPase FtsK/SpoIIIE
MAAKKRAKSEKSVLNRQTIASRKRALSDKRLSSPGTGQKAIVAVFLLAFSLLSLLAVATFSVKDRVGPGFENAVGPVGHALSEALRGLLGVCAYVLPLGGLWASVVMFVGKPGQRRWPQVVSLFFLVVSTSVLAQLVFEGREGFAHAPGGLLGQAVTQVLVGLFSTVGTVVLVSAVATAALIVGTQLAFLRFLNWVGRVMAAWAERLQVWAFDFWEQQQLAAEKRREARLRAREEEAAFLAQLEKEHQELEEAEREIAEAEAKALEALRLSREAEEEKAAKAQMKALAKEGRAPKKVEPMVDPNAPTLPPGDPAWALTLGPPGRAESPRKKERKAPNLVSPTPLAAALPVLDAPVTVAAETKAMEPTPAVVPAPVPMPVPLAEVKAEGLLRAPVAEAPLVARTPVIVEPKAPPKPTKKKEQFEFIGDRKSFNVPPLDVLEASTQERTALDKDAFFATAEKLRAKLADFGIVGEVVEIRPGPVVTMYEFLPGPGIKVSKIAALADDLAMAMEAMRVRIVAPIPGKGVVGIEVPNRDRETVYLRDIAEQDAFSKSSSRLTMCIGKDIEGMPYVLDLGKAPHLLMAGTTGSGKSVAVNSMIMSILLKSTPEEVRFIMVDPKKLELSVYEGIPHLLLPVVTDPRKAALALRWAVDEMERRYQILADAGVRNIAGYNKLVETQTVEGTVKKESKAPANPGRKMIIVDVGDEAKDGASLGVAAPKEELGDVREAVEAEVKVAETETEIRVDDNNMNAELPLPEAAADKKEPLKKLPYIVVIIDELADLMMVASREVETYIARLAQMARAAGIHLMVATQRPSTDVVTGVIKANVPTRISFMLRSKPDSMTILGTVGAEALLGMGDMLIMPPTSAHMQRVHGAFVSEIEIKRAVDHLKAQGKPVFDESILKPREEDAEEAGGQDDELSDELWDQALATVAEMKAVSISMLQRKMRIGYNRAARMIERMERDGIVGPADGAKPREVLIQSTGMSVRAELVEGQGSTGSP